MRNRFKHRDFNIIFFLFLGLLSFLFFYSAISAGAGRGVNIVLKDKSGKEVGLYKESHALIIGVSGYTGGWPKLPGVLTDVKLLKEELEQQGFQVVVVKDPNRSSLLSAYDDFINKYGNDADNRLLFYFAGHGHTMKLKYGGDMGYIVPADTPNPNQDERGFLLKAVSMQQIEVYAKNIQSKHAMFLFDSCFSGSIFNLTRAVPEIISEKTSKPVRQFITSGDAGEQVPDESVFRGQFIAALKGKGDLNGDGYVTGVELGEFLQDKVVNYSKGTQHPKYGKIRDPNLDEGDFVFPLRMASLGAVSTPPPPPSLPLSIPAAPAPVVLQGHLQVNVNAPSARVFINGEEKGTVSPGSPLNMENLSTGTASIRVEAEGYESGQRTVTVQRNQWTQEVFELKRIQVASLPPPPPPQITPPLKKEGEGGFNMVLIPSGEFMAGRPGSLKGMVVSEFYIDKYEVTQREYEQVMGNNPSRFKGCDNCPVESVTWNEAKKYCGKVGKRLPTEWEWEKAAKGGTTTTYYWGESEGMAGDYVWYKNNSDSETHPVGQKKPNNYGLYDMAGNVWEWTSTDDKNSNKVLLGGSWHSLPYGLRSSDRARYEPSTRDSEFGFRCAGASGQ
ncbi:MAG: SUMF1/EgtB/PvdO family nonheme iron enzyme [Nitrospinae bacterium]|nr:SUMF1/EgtB/PvdO family nonheme iron enzyme [Nitrospinota bacterium]